MERLKQCIKKNKILYNIAKNIQSILNLGTSQKKIMKKVLKYNKKRFIKYSGCYKQSKQKDEAYMTWLYHVVEKGLAMPNMKLGFGHDKIIELSDLIDKYYVKYGLDETLESAISALKEYQRVHELKKYLLNDDVVIRLEKLQKQYPNILPMNQVVYKNEEFYKDINGNFEKFAYTRHSIRNYDTNEKIDMSIIFKSIELATTAPSACNRQPARVHVVTQHDKIMECLSLQNGNRGFGFLADKLLIITGELGTVLGAQEFFDLNTNVGIFIMNLCYALHYNKVANCVLNWYALPKQDIKLRKILEIPDSENVIAFIVCGIAPNEFKIVKSPRLTTNQIIKVH